MAAAAETIVSKITVRSMKVTPQKFITEGKTVPIARIYGLARAIKAVVDKNRGEIFESIVGQFEGVNLETGEVFQSGTLYLPSGIHAMLESAVKSMKEEDDSIKFALEIGVVKATNAAGYSYEARSLVKAETVDPLADLRGMIGHAPKTPQIEAPKSDPTKK